MRRRPFHIRVVGREGLMKYIFFQNYIPDKSQRDSYSDTIICIIIPHNIPFVINLHILLWQRIHMLLYSLIICVQKREQHV